MKAGSPANRRPSPVSRGRGEALEPLDRKDETRLATVTTPLRIGPAVHGRTMTLEEFLDADIEERYRCELARGGLEVKPVPDDPHGVVDCNLYRGVDRHDRQHPGFILRYGGATSSSSSCPG